MGKKNKNKNKLNGAEKTAMKTDKKLIAKQKKVLEKLGEDDISDIVTKLELCEQSVKDVTDVLCDKPSPRSNFSLVTHPERDELILFGGEFFNGQKVFIYNDLFFYNILKNEWKQLRSPSGPTPRSGHQMVSLAADGGQLWVFGGEYASPSQSQFYHYKDLWVMNLRSKKWDKIAAPNAPSARSGHRMIASKKRLIVFGGFHDNNHFYNYFNDVHIFSLETYTWLEIQVGGIISPPPRSGCCISATDGKVLIWGGYSKTNMKKDIHRGITHTDMFLLIPESVPNKFIWNRVKPGGVRPIPRSSVACTTAPNGNVYCFGGVMDVDESEEDVQGVFGNELLMLDTVSYSWRSLDVVKKTKVNKNNSPSVITDVEMDTDTSPPTVTMDGIFTMTVAGVSNSSNILPKVPSLFPNRTSACMPTPRMSPGLCVSKGVLYLYGGIYEENNKQYTFNDFYALDLHKLDEWKVLIPNDMEAHNWIDSESSESDDSDSSEQSDMDNTDF